MSTRGQGLAKIHVASMQCAHLVYACNCIYLCIAEAVSFGYFWAESGSNWANIRLWLLLLMSVASRGEDTEEELSDKHPGNILHFPHLPVYTLRKGLRAPLVHCWLHHCLLRLPSLLQAWGIYLERDLGKDTFCSWALVWMCCCEHS